MLQIDSTDVLRLTFSYQAPDAAGSEAVTLAQLDADFWQQKAYGDISYRVNLAGRDLYENDFLSFNLGSGAISEIPLEILCYVTDNDFTIIMEEAAVCNTENLDDVKLKFLKDVTTREFFVHFKHITMPEYATPGVVATFKFNGDYSAFASTELPYANL